MLTFSKLIEIQKSFNRGKFVDYDTATIEDRQRLTKEYVLHALDELHEILRLVNWKMHRRSDFVVDEFELSVELVDALKFIGNIAAVWGMKADDLDDVFEKKTLIVEGKYEASLYPHDGPLISVYYDVASKHADKVAGLADTYGAMIQVIGGTSKQRFEAMYQLVGIWRIAATTGDVYTPYVIDGNPGIPIVDQFHDMYVKLDEVKEEILGLR